MKNSVPPKKERVSQKEEERKNDRSRDRHRSSSISRKDTSRRRNQESQSSSRSRKDTPRKRERESPSSSWASEKMHHVKSMKMSDSRKRVGTKGKYNSTPRDNTRGRKNSRETHRGEHDSNDNTWITDPWQARREQKTRRRKERNDSA